MSTTLKAWLRLNQLTEDPNDFTATISGAGSKNLNDIVDEIINDGTENKRETILSIIGRFQTKAMQLLLTGHNVNTGMIYMRPVIKGSFYNKQWNPETNSVYVAMNQGAELREAIAQTSVDFLGVQSDPIEIYNIVNMNNPNAEGVIEKGKNIEIKGGYIRIAGDDPKCGIDFRNTTSNEVFRLPMANIVLNEPSRLMLLLPVEMINGEYELTISTQYTKGNTQLKTPRSVVYHLPLIVT